MQMKGRLDLFLLFAFSSGRRHLAFFHFFFIEPPENEMQVLEYQKAPRIQAHPLVNPPSPPPPFSPEEPHGKQQGHSAHSPRTHRSIPVSNACERLRCLRPVLLRDTGAGEAAAGPQCRLDRGEQTSLQCLIRAVPR